MCLKGYGFTYFREYKWTTIVQVRGNQKKYKETKWAAFTAPQRKRVAWLCRSSKASSPGGTLLTLNEKPSFPEITRIMSMEDSKTPLIGLTIL